MPSDTSVLLNNLFNQGGHASDVIHQNQVMINEGYRIIFLNFNYNTTSGRLEYAASVFQRRELTESEYNLMKKCQNPDVDFQWYSWYLPKLDTSISSAIT